jgi:hypothetical protein
MFVVLFPLADLAAAGFQFLFGWQALRNFRQYVQYNAPGDVVTSWPSWKTPTQLDPHYPIANFKAVCDVAVDPSNPPLCGGPSNNTNTPRYYSYNTTVTLLPMVLGGMLCPNPPTVPPCSFKLSYSAPFQ